MSFKVKTDQNKESMPNLHRMAPDALKRCNHMINSANSETVAQIETTSYFQLCPRNKDLLKSI